MHSNFTEFISGLTSSGDASRNQEGKIKSRPQEDKSVISILLAWGWGHGDSKLTGYFL